VVEDGTHRVVGILTHRDVRFFEDYAKPVSELMTKDVITVKGKPEKSLAMRMLPRAPHREAGRPRRSGQVRGLITVKDIERQARYVNATRDAHVACAWARVAVCCCEVSGRVSPSRVLLLDRLLGAFVLRVVCRVRCEAFLR